MARGHAAGASPVESLEASAFTIPTESRETDGTLDWETTTIVVVEAESAGERGLGYSYTHRAAVDIIRDKLASVVCGRDALAVQACQAAMLHEVRNMGRPGLVACAISAVDVALWDLKARLLGVPLARLLGMVHERIAIYGSGGFTSYDMQHLQQQLGRWTASGISRVKMKVGRHPEWDPQRVFAAREAIGQSAELYVDANGAYSRKQALELAERFREAGVSWFEEPVSSEDLAGLRLLRDRAPAGLNIAAGEYGYDPFYFQRMLEADAVDVLQADATRCLGITGFLTTSALCEARSMPLSAHTAPALHLHVCCASKPLVHLEYFYDHVRIERMLFDGIVEPSDGSLEPDLSRPGHGLLFKRAEAARFAA